MPPGPLGTKPSSVTPRRCGLCCGLCWGLCCRPRCWGFCCGCCGLCCGPPHGRRGRRRCGLCCGLCGPRRCSRLRCGLCGNPCCGHPCCGCWQNPQIFSVSDPTCRTFRQAAATADFSKLLTAKLPSKLSSSHHTRFDLFNQVHVAKLLDPSRPVRSVSSPWPHGVAAKRDGTPSRSHPWDHGSKSCRPSSSKAPRVLCQTPGLLLSRTPGLLSRFARLLAVRTTSFRHTPGRATHHFVSSAAKFVKRGQRDQLLPMDAGEHIADPVNGVCHGPQLLGRCCPSVRNPAAA